MLNYLKNKIRENEFNPGLLGLVTNPFFIARLGLSNNIRELADLINGRVLDIGCGTKPYQKYFSYAEYIGLEYDTGIDSEKKDADYYYSGDKFPFEDTSFDSAVCNQVLEHIFNPELFLSEVNRVLKLNAKLLLTVPFIWDEHEQPIDYARYSSFGLKHLLENKGFKVIRQKKTVDDFRVNVQLVNAYLYKISRNVKVIKQLVQLFIIFPVNVLGILISFLLPSNKDLYLDNIFLCEKDKNLM